MAVHYVRLPAAYSRDREHVSIQWAAVLADMHAAGVSFNVNEGHRTFARQAQLVRQKGVWSPSNPYGAARPSNSAPHIKTGSIAHAIDFSNDPAVFSWLSRHGLHPARTVSTESWHIECPAYALEAYYRKRSARKRAAKRKHNKHVKYLLRHAGYPHLSDDGSWGKAARRALKKFQQEQGLKQDGIAGPNTMRRLRSALLPTIRPKGKAKASDIKAAKRLLRRNGYKIVISGGRGYLYRRAVKAFKKKHHLHVDEIFGPAAWRAARKK